MRLLTSEEREQLRLSVLRFLEANNTRFGLTVPLLLQMGRNEGRPWLEVDHLNAELLYLEDKRLVSEVLKGISRENRAFRITADGRDMLSAEC